MGGCGPSAGTVFLAVVKQISTRLVSGKVGRILGVLLAGLGL